MIDIVFNINQLALEGMGATLTSLVKNCSDNSQLKLNFFCSSLTKTDKENISNLLEQEKFLGQVNFIDFEPSLIFGHLPSLHGQYTIYGRLLISEYIKSDFALYLDADLVILLDILELVNYDFQKNALAATFGCKIPWSLDHAFFENTLHWGADRDYFNSGVVLFNLKHWRENKMDAKWKNLAARYPDQLTSHDQTLLNAICDGNFSYLDGKFNNLWEPGNKPPENWKNSILHFSGSPKPWDLLGKVIHPGYATWKSYNSDYWKDKYGKLTLAKLIRSWKIKKSLIKHLSNRVIATA